MCHQSVSLAARSLEAAGIPTIIAGSALDIVEHCGVPRYVFTDIPLGNPCGKPEDRTMQTAIMRQALELLVNAQQPRSTQVTPFVWGDGLSWRASYAQVREDNREALRALGDVRRQRRARLPS